jgi:hypothetical protein
MTGSNAPMKIGGYNSSAVNLIEAETRKDQVPVVRESGFLLDWLAGGVACERNIQGFSFKFETLKAVAAR